MNVVPLGYKRTDVGVIPEDWEVCELGDCCSLYQPHTISQKELDSYAEFPVYGANGIIGNYHCFNHEKSEIIIGCRGTCGAVNYSLPRSWINGNAMVVHVHSSARVLQKYLLQHLRCFGGIQETIITGGTQPQITREPLSHVRVFFPSDRGEQKKILGVLSDVDELLATKENLLAKKRAIKRGAMQELLTGKRRLPGFSVTPMKRTAIGEIPADWEVAKLDQIGIWHRAQPFSKKDIRTDGVIPCIHYGEIYTLYGEVIKDVKSRTNREVKMASKKGDILFATSDVTPTGLGRCSALMVDGVLVGSDILILRLHRGLCAPFISYAVNHNKSQVIEHVTGTTVKHVNSAGLSMVQIALPPSIEEQLAIAACFSDMVAEMDLLKVEIAKLSSIKRCLMQELLTGKIRLKK